MANNLITLTVKDANSTSTDINTGELISLVGQNSDADSLLTLVTKNQRKTLLVDETPSEIAALTSEMIPLTLVSDSTVTYYANASRVLRVYANGSGADVWLDDETVSLSDINVSESQAAVQSLVNAVDVSDSTLTSATATADGLTTGLLTGASQFVQITSAAAANIIALPLSTSVPIGTVIQGYVDSNGFELRVDVAEATSATINGVTTNVEAAIPSTTKFKVELVLAGEWILTAVTELGAQVTPIVPDAV